MKHASLAKFVILLLTTCVFPNPSNSLYFHMRGTDRKCFIEDVPHDTTVIGKYQLELWDETTSDFSSSYTKAVGLHVEVKDPLQELVLSKVYMTAGRFTFTSHASGEYSVCLAVNHTLEEPDNRGWGSRLYSGGYPDNSPVRIHIDIRNGGQAIDYDLVSRMEKLTAIQLRIRKLLDLTDQISQAQDYQRTRESRFRQTSESTSSRVFWYAVLQTAVFFGSAYYQVLSLKSFFVAKKLV